MSEYRTSTDDLFVDAGGTAVRRVSSLAGLDKAVVDWCEGSGFKAKPGQVCRLPDGSVLLGAAAEDDPFGALAAGAIGKMPAGTYALEGADGLAALGFALGAYDFAGYREAKPQPSLQMPEGVDAGLVRRMVRATYLARDLINIPANDLGPSGIERAARGLAEEFGAAIDVTVGDDLLDGFPMIHTVGRASADAPRLIDITWGAADAPKVTLVGKGVSFDTGGLNIKPGSSMALMKKDMGGAANVLGLALAIMDAKLPVRLRVLVPAVENAIAGNAFRPGDVLRSRLGPTVEIGNTDAEGRLILADALALADEEEPEILIDMATLTGAARVALGPDLPPLFTADDDFAREVEEAGTALADPVWRMPLWGPYDAKLKSSIADVNHISTGGFAGAVTAALFLQRFVSRAKVWVHLDIFGWAPDARPHGPVGGEAYAIRALYHVIATRFPTG